MERRGLGRGARLDRRGRGWYERRLAVRGIAFWRKRNGLVWVTMAGVEPVRPDERPAGLPGWAAFEAAARRFAPRVRIADAGRSPRRRKVY